MRVRVSVCFEGKQMHAGTVKVGVPEVLRAGSKALSVLADVSEFLERTCIRPAPLKTLPPPAE